MVKKLLALACFAAAVTAAPAGSLDYGRRLEAHRAVEQILWAHRIWPESNPEPKPPLEDVLPESELRARVDDVLRKSAALDAIWKRPVGNRELQAELDRIVRDSRDPAMLEEMFDALGRDPVLVAEAIARPVLVDRLIRSWYEGDSRFHGEERRRAEAAMATVSSVDDLARVAPRYQATTWTLDDAKGSAITRTAGTIAVDASQWSDLTEKLGGLAVGQVGRLEETETAFAATVVLSKGERSLRAGAGSWPKTSFEIWWSVERERHRPAQADLRAGEPALTIPAATRSVATPGCVDDSWIKTGTGAPARRVSNAAVWTGTEMIVWGGNAWNDDGSSHPSRSGGRYDPVTDTWSTITTIDSPDGGQGVSAVWTGTRLIVWGGLGSNTGGLYDPVTDRWTPMTTTGAPSAREAKVAVWTGSLMVIWGEQAIGGTGSGGRYDPVNDTWTPTTMTGAPSNGLQRGVWSGTEMIVWPGKRYDPAADVWRPISSVGEPAHRSYAAVAWTGSRMIVWGGSDFWTHQYFGDGGVYDPVADAWSAMTATNAPEARDTMAYAWVANRFVVWGGFVNYSFGWTVNTGGRYDPATDTWTPTTTVGAPSARAYSSAVVAGNEMIVWAGASTYFANSVVNSGGRYNPLTDSWVATRVGLPSPQARSQHSAIWSGAEMIVWGGTGYDAVLSDGGAYTPATDSWNPTSLLNAPSKRIFPAAVWTGTSMLVWGGLDQNGQLGTGSRYDPIGHSWSPISTAGAPGPREGMTAVWTGSRMIVWGGWDGTTTLFDGGRYDPASDTWLAVNGTGAPFPRAGHTAVWTGSSMIVWGGAGASGFDLNTGGRYDPGTDAWTPTTTTNAPGVRFGHAAVWTGDRMLIWGGWHTGVLGDGSSYDSVANAWSPLPTAGAPAPRYDTRAVWTGNELILWGGADTNDTMASGARYRPDDGTWRSTSLSGVPGKRAAHTIVWTGNKLLVWGGSRHVLYSAQVYNDGAAYCACVDWYPDADGDGYGAAPGAISVCDGTHPAGTVARAGDCNDWNAAIHPGVSDNTCDAIDDDCDGPADEDYLTQPSVCGLGVCRSFGFRECIGGQIENSCVPSAPNSPTDTSCNTLDDDCDGPADEDFPQTEDYWTATMTAPAARTNHTAVWSGSEMIVFGGDNGSGSVQNGGYAYAPGSDAWRALAAGPTKRWHHTAVWTGSRMVVWGGDDNVVTIYNNGSRYDPATDTWAATTTTGAPVARGLHSAVWTGSRVVIWGGINTGGALNTGSRYDPAGNTWSATATSGAPTARYSHSAVWSGSEMLVWGGNSAGGALGTGARYNPTANTWTAIATAGAPTARYGHVAVWTGSEMIVWGGTADGVTYYSGGARYDPAANTWTPVSTLNAPERRAFASSAWTGTELVVWGGMFRTNEVPDTPRSDGARYNPASDTWSFAMTAQISPPSSRARAQAVWTGNEMIVWGGDPVGGALASGGRYNPRTLCGNGGCQRVGSTFCAAGSVGFQCTPAPASAETCDTVDNDCNGLVDDGIPVPTARPAILASKLPGTVNFSWMVTPDTTAYDIVRGGLGALRATAGNFTSSTDSCLVNDIRAEAIEDATVPASANGFWYLVRPVNLCSGVGTYDDPIPSQLGLRDAEIAASGVACP